MTKKQMYMKLVVNSLIRRKARMIVALLAVAIGATIMSGLVTIYYDIPRQLGKEFRSYGANFVVLPAENEKITEEEFTNIKKQMSDQKIVGMAPYRYETTKINQQPYILTGTDMIEVKKNSPFWYIEGEWSTNDDTDEVMIGKEISKKLNPTEKNIVIVHTGISGGENTLPGLVSTSILDLFKDKAIYVAGGHIHSLSTYPKEKPFFFVPGSLEFSNAQNENSDRKGFFLFDTDTLAYSFIETKHRTRIQKSFTYADFLNIETEFENFVIDLNLTGEEILVVSMGVKNNDYINTEKLENIAENNGALKTHILIKNIFNINNKSNENGASLTISEIEKNLIDSWGIFEKDDFSNNFDTLKELFRSDDDDSFIELFDKILEGTENAN